MVVWVNTIVWVKMHRAAQLVVKPSNERIIMTEPSMKQALKIYSSHLIETKK